MHLGELRAMQALHLGSAPATRRRRLLNTGGLGRPALRERMPRLPRANVVAQNAVLLADEQFAVGNHRVRPARAFAAAGHFE